MKLRLLDESLAGTITHASTISVKFPCGTLLQIRFLLTKLDHDFPAVLGLDWLTLHNLLIDWVRHSVTFRDRTNSPPTPPSDPKPSLASVWGSVTSHLVPSMVSSSDDTKLRKTSVPISVPIPDPVSVSDPAPSTPTNSGTTPNISLLSAAAFQKAMHSEGAQCFSAFIQNPNKAAGRRVTPASESDLEGVPNIYHHFSDVFSKGSADSLPPHREYDLKIDMDETAKAPLGPVYPSLNPNWVLSENLLMSTLTWALSVPLIPCLECLSFSSKRRTVLSGYVLISDNSTPSLERINIPFHLYLTF